jgi:hypothetical protein
MARSVLECASPLALGYVRHKADQIGNELIPQCGTTAAGGSPAKIVKLPFVK